MTVHSSNGRNQGRTNRRGRTRWNRSQYRRRKVRTSGRPDRKVRTSGRPDGDLSEMNLAGCPKLLGTQQGRPSWTRQHCGHQPWPNSCCTRILAAHQHQSVTKNSTETCSCLGPDLPGALRQGGTHEPHAPTSGVLCQLAFCLLLPGLPLGPPALQLFNLPRLRLAGKLRRLSHPDGANDPRGPLDLNKWVTMKIRDLQTGDPHRQWQSGHWQGRKRSKWGSYC